LLARSRPVLQITGKVRQADRVLVGQNQECECGAVRRVRIRLR